MTVTPLLARSSVVTASVQGTLALDLRDSLEAPWPRPLRPIDGPDTGLEPEPDPLRDPVLVAPGGRAGEVDQVAQGFARALAEVLGGDRGPGQVLRWTTPEVYDVLQRRTALLTSTVPPDRRVRRLRSRVHSVRVSRPSVGVAEVSIHLRRGEQSQAVAARLEHRVQRHRGRFGAAWVCTALELG